MSALSLFAVVIFGATSIASAYETNSLTFTSSQCTTSYSASYPNGSNKPFFNTTLKYYNWPTTEAYTTSAYSRFAKTIVLTPRASTVIVTETSTSISYWTLRDDTTVTVYPSTSYDTFTSTTYKTVTSTTTSTVSTPATSTVPADPGFIPVASANPDASLRDVQTEIDKKWDVEDQWWTPDETQIYYLDRNGAESLASTAELEAPSILPLAMEPVAAPFPTATEESRFSRPINHRLARRDRYPFAPVGNPDYKVICTYTVQENWFGTTATIIRSSASTPTFTRTTYVDTITTTSTVRAKPTTSWSSIPTTTVDWAFWTSNTTFTTLTTTVFETATTTVTDPSSTSTAYEACNSANRVDNVSGFPITQLDGKWWDYNNNATDFVLQSYYNYNGIVDTAESCCNRAAENPNTIFYKYNSGSCDIYTGTKCPAAGSLSRNGTDKVEVNVYYEPIAVPAYYWSYTVGNGACGSVNILSAWEDN
ncbi:hypothetical protein ACN47E_009278 [Coniothyrium glycines]